MGVDRSQLITQLLAGQRADGSFGVHPYSKWKGAHWRLVSLVELGVPKTSGPARAAPETVLDWMAAPVEPLVIKGLQRRHASVEGNALAVCCRLGMAKDARVRHLVDVLLRAQWPDGGWNCDKNPKAHRSSFHESLAPIWGLVEFHRATGDMRAVEAAQRTGELLLEHRLFRTLSSGRVINPEWIQIHWPHYWHYDFFHGMRAVAMLGRIGDGRTADATKRLRELRRPDGTWAATGRRYWRRSNAGTGVEAVTWGDASELITPIARALLE